MDEVKKNNRAVVCIYHSGCISDITHLQDSDRMQWTNLDKISDRLDSFSTRMNVTLGGVAVSCILLAVNIILMRGGVP